MVWICSKCEHGWHTSCTNRWSCDCKCNVGSDADAIQKSAAFGGGLGLAIGGLALTICTGGLGAVLVGGAMLGAGVSSTWNSAEKAIKGERMDGKTYLVDVAFGAITGVATGGMGAAGETIATNVVKQGAKQVTKVGVKKFAVRAATGVVTGVTTKAIDEFKQCSTTDKNWSDYGKTFDKNGNENGTVASWLTSAVVGGLGGASSHVSSNLSKSAASGVTKSITRVGVSGTTAAASDAIIQGANIAVGNQDEYDTKRTFTSATTSVIMTAAQEGTKNAIYRANGGKNNMLEVQSNKKSIEENVPKQDQIKLKKGYEDLKKIDNNKLASEESKAATYTLEQQQKVNHQNNVDHYDAEIQKEIASKNAALQSKPKDIAKMGQHQREIDKLINQKKNEIQNFNSNFKQTVLKDDLGKMNNDNAHFLTGDRVKQISIDISSSTGTSRGATRAVFDYDNSNPKRPGFKFSGYTNQHNYGNMPRYGKSDYYKIHENYENNLRAVNGEVNNLMCNHASQDETKRRKKEKKQT